MRSLLKSACLLCALALSAWAQTDRGSITGTVLDPGGAVIADAAIEARNTANGAVFASGSSATGNFVIPVPTGNYELIVTVPGFKRYVRPNIAVPVAQSVRVDVTLEVGASAESITVTDELPLLKTESGELSHNVTTDRLNQLPILQINAVRNPYSLVSLLPGAQINATGVRVNGTPGNTQALRVDGQDSTNGLWQFVTGSTQPSVDAIQEMSIQTSNYAAEFGQAGGAVFNATMRSGTNQYHGSAYNYMTNEALNAGLPFTNAGTQTPLKEGQHIRNRTRLNDYGFTLGGPVRIPKIYNGQDRTFFFFNWEQWRNVNFTSNAIQTMPTPAMRQGDFSNTGLANPRTITTDPVPVIEGVIYDPATEQLVNGLRVRQPFAGNLIPLTRLDPVVAKIQSYLPLPTNSNLQNNRAVPTYSVPRQQTLPSVKIDQNLNSKMKVSGYWGLNMTRSPGGDGLPVPITTRQTTNDTSNTIRLNFDYTVTPTVLLHLGAGLVHYSTAPQVAEFNALQELGFTGQNRPYFPNITGASSGARGGLASGIGVPTKLSLVNTKPTANVSLTWVKNNHTYKFGGEMIIEGYPALSETYSNGIMTFSSDQTGQPFLLGRPGLVATPGHNYASFFLGGVNSGTFGTPAKTRLGSHSFAGFVQDTWKVNRKLTLDYGLRYDYSTYLHEQYGRTPIFGANVFNPTVGRMGGTIFEGRLPGRCQCDVAKNYPFAFGPRVGVAYQFNDKTVLRVGMGVSYGRGVENGFLSYSVGSIFNYSTPTPYNPAFNMRDGIPYKVTFPDFNPGLYPFAGQLNTPSFVIDQNAGRPARQVQLSVGLQREVVKNLVVEVSYVGNRGAWWQGSTTQLNAVTIQHLAANGLSLDNQADRELLVATSNSNLARQRGFGTPYAGFPGNNTVLQSLRPFPQFGTGNSALTPIWTPTGRTWYDSLQSKVTKRYSHGLDIEATFTYQKELTIGAENSYPLGAAFGGGQGASVNDIFNYKQNKYLSAQSRPFQFVVAGNYVTPKWRVNRWIGQLTGGWQIGAVMRYQSGTLINVPGTNNALGAQLGRGTWMERVPGVNPFLKDPNCHCFDATQELVLNPAAFTQTPQGKFSSSTARYNDFRWQRQPSEAMNVGRNFRFGSDGRYNLQIRAEFTNVFNRTFHGTPSTNYTAATQRNNDAFRTLSSGYGWVNTTNGAGSQPRSGTIVGRFTF